MIKTEAMRKIVKTNYSLPSDVQIKLDDLNKLNPYELVLYFDEETQKWQIYRVKTHAAIRDEDILCWQMSAPTEGLAISTGIFDWLKKYDQSNGGYYDSEDLKQKWLKQWKILRMKEAEIKRKRKEELKYAYKPIIDDLETTRVAVPITVGFNNKTKKRILAVPEGTHKKMKKQERRVMSG